MSDENSRMESKAAASSTQTVHCFQGFHEASQVQNPVSFRLAQNPTFWSWNWRNCIVSWCMMSRKSQGSNAWRQVSYHLDARKLFFNNESHMMLPPPSPLVQCSLISFLLSSAYVFSFSLRLLVSLLSRSSAGSCCCRPASSSLLLISLHKPAFLHLSFSSTKFPSSPPYRPS